MSKHIMPQISKEHVNFSKQGHKFQKISYSGIISFVCVGKEEIHKNMQDKVSVAVMYV